MDAIQFLNRVVTFRKSVAFRKSVSNSSLSVAEYVVQPLSMLLAAPFLVRHLGLEQFGIWVLVSAILGSIGILSTGFGDATVKYVSAYRGQTDAVGIARTIGATLTMNVALGAAFGALVWFAAPSLAEKLFRVNPSFYRPTVQAIQISAVILIVRSAESVFVSAQKAFEQYGAAVKLNVFLRIVVVLSAVILALRGQGIVAIMWMTLAWSTVVVVFQALAARRVVGELSFLPSFRRDSLREVFAYGCFSWIQSLAGVILGYADRFLLAALLGPASVGIYTVCVQAAQPIHSVHAAAYNFLFPHLSARHAAGDKNRARQIFRLALVSNIVSALILAALLVFAGKLLLPFWMGRDFADKAYTTFAILAVSYAVLSISIVPHFGLLAMGKVRFVAILNICSGIVLLPVILLLVPIFHLPGAAIGRFVYCASMAIPYSWASIRAFRGPRDSEKPPHSDAEDCRLGDSVNSVENQIAQVPAGKSKCA